MALPLSDWDLLKRYSSSKSEEAFATVVGRHARLVYSAALRQTRDSHEAEDVSQAVFLILAGKAGGLPKRTVLSAWLLRTTYFVAANARRKRVRRQEMERMFSLERWTETEGAWKKISPLLDEALLSLSASNRNAISLRFFEGRNFKEIAQSLAISSDAAQKKVSRAVESLRVHLRKNGVALPSVLIVGALGKHAVHAAPDLLASSIVDIVSSEVRGTAVCRHLAEMTIRKARRTSQMRALLGTSASLVVVMAVWVGVGDISDHRSPRMDAVATAETIGNARNPAPFRSGGVGPVRNAVGNRSGQKPNSVNVSGVVVDAETQESIPDFEVWIGDDVEGPGPGGITAVTGWEPTLRWSGKAGRFSFPLEPVLLHTVSYNIEVRAEGFVTARLLAPAAATDGSNFTFALQRAPLIRGAVLAPDGTPAVGADVMLSTKDLGVYMSAPGRLDFARSRGTHAQTDEAGRFVVQVDPGTNTVFVAHTSGYFQGPLEQLGAAPSITLDAWGRVEGTLNIGNRPGSNEWISLGCKLWPRTTHPLNLALSATTDSTGHFVIDSVPPGKWEIAHRLPANDTSYIGFTQRSPVEVRSGETNSVTIGGTGWRVVGKLRSSEPSEQINWSRQVGTKLTSEFPQSQIPIQYFSIPDASGAFEIADVQPGLYRLSIEGFPFPPGPLQPFNKQVTIPEPNSHTEPGSWDLGTLDLKSRK